MQPIPSTFLNEKRRWLTKVLFVETNSLLDYTPVYTLSPQDRVEPCGTTYPSLHRLYVNLADTTEYQFANKYLGGWQHWQELCSQEFFIPYLNRMRDELEIKIRSQALENIVGVANDNSSRGYLDANKFIVKELGMGTKNDTGNASKRGRPSKAEIENHIALEVKSNRRVLDDLARITKN